MPRLIFCLTFCLLACTAQAKTDWTTPAEASGFQHTPDYAQSVAYLQRLAAAAPERLHLVSMGTSPEGRELWVAVATNGGEFTPEAARASGKEILFVQAGIHAGEIEGKDAGLMLLRDVAVLQRWPHLLDRTILLYLPMFNVDGHERRSPYHRVNQNGPAETGWRGTAQNVNLNRDYVKADAPEMQAWLAFWHAWQPDLLVDVHTTDGMDYQYDLTWYTEGWGKLHPALEEWQQRVLEKSVFPATQKRGHLLSPYLELVDGRDPTKGIANFGSGPRFSTGYAALENRAGLLLETHMLKSYRTRVVATYDLVLSLLERLAAKPGELRKAVMRADADAAKLAANATAVPLDFSVAKTSVPFTLQGYAYTNTKSDISGADWTRYDPRHKKTYTIPNYRDLDIVDSAIPPAAYVVPAAWTDAIAKLRQHGVRMERLDHPTRLHATAYRLSDPHWAAQPFENRLMLSEFALATEAQDGDVPAGSMLVPMDQPQAKLIVHLLEPRAPDSLLRWGAFNIVFEQREYPEPRVAEQIARDELAQHPQLQAEFDAKLKDPEFAKSAHARLDFFFQRSAWHDERLGLYPVLRLDAAEVERLHAVAP